MSIRLPAIVVFLALVSGCDHAPESEHAVHEARADASVEPGQAAVGSWHERVEWPLEFCGGIVGQYDYDLTLWPDGEELRMLWVSWGPRLQPHGFDFKRAGDWELPATGAPVFPAAAVDLVGKARVQPVTGERWVGPGDDGA